MMISKREKRAVEGPNISASFQFNRTSLIIRVSIYLWLRLSQIRQGLICFHCEPLSFVNLCLCLTIVPTLPYFSLSHSSYQTHITFTKPHQQAFLPTHTLKQIRQPFDDPFLKEFYDFRFHSLILRSLLWSIYLSLNLIWFHFSL